MSTYIVFDMFHSSLSGTKRSHDCAFGCAPPDPPDPVDVLRPKSSNESRGSPSESCTSSDTPPVARAPLAPLVARPPLDHGMLVLLMVRRVLPWMQHVADEHDLVNATWRLLASASTAAGRVAWHPRVADIGAALWLVFKVMHQRYPTATEMAAMLGVRKADLVHAELDMCARLDWNVMAAAGLVDVRNAENCGAYANGGVWP